jgi:hypothetical protein
MAIGFFLAFFFTIKQIVHNPDRYITPAVITALLGAYFMMLMIEEVS